MSQTSTYAELKQQIATLERQAESARQAELAAVIAEIRQKIADYGLSAADLGLLVTPASRKPKPAPTVTGPRLSAGRYRNPADGAIYTYAGRGRKPAWLAAMSADEIERCRVVAENA